MRTRDRGGSGVQLSECGLRHGGGAASVDAALLLDSGDAVDNGLVQDGGAAEALALRAIGL